MSTPSIRNQLDYVLGLLAWNKEQIDNFKTKHGVPSVKKALRPSGNPTAQLPAILSVRTKAGYLQTCETFFARAYQVSGKKKLADLMTPEIIRKTLDKYYQDKSPATLRTLLAALEKVHLGCRRARWLKGHSPITPELRERVRNYRDDGSLRLARFGYQLEDAPQIIARLEEKESVFALPAEIALRCGLRLSEIAGLQGKDIDSEHLTLHIKGKGGKHRTISIPTDLTERLDTSKQYLFNPNRAWKSAFYQAVRQTARELGITVSGVHRLRANFAQNNYHNLREQGLSEKDARKMISKDLGHNRINVTKSYVP